MPRVSSPSDCRRLNNFRARAHCSTLYIVRLGEGGVYRVTSPSRPRGNYTRLLLLLHCCCVRSYSGGAAMTLTTGGRRLVLILLLFSRYIIIVVVGVCKNTNYQPCSVYARKENEKTCYVTATKSYQKDDTCAYVPSIIIIIININSLGPTVETAPVAVTRTTAAVRP